MEELVPKRTKEMALRSNSFSMVRCNWFILIVLPWAKQRSGKKVIIGDNLSSHVSTSVSNEYAENDMPFSVQRKVHGAKLLRNAKQGIRLTPD